MPKRQLKVNAPQTKKNDPYIAQQILEAKLGIEDDSRISP